MPVVSKRKQNIQNIRDMEAGAVSIFLFSTCLVLNIRVCAQATAWIVLYSILISVFLTKNLAPA